MNINRLDLVSVRVFVAVVQGGSFSAGARLAHLSVAAVSKRIAELEQVIGSTLFERHAAGVRLTPAGQALLNHALTLQRDLERLASELDDFAQGVAGHIRVWANPSALAQDVATKLASFCAAFPNIKIDFEERLSASIVRGLHEGRADLGVFVDNIPHDGLTVRYFGQDPMVLAVPRGHPLTTSGRPIRLSDALDFDFVSLQDSYQLNSVLTMASAEDGRTFKVRALSRGMDGICRLVGAGMGLSVIPEAVVKCYANSMKIDMVRLTDSWATREILTGVRDLPTAPQALGALFEHLAVSRP